MQNKTLQSKRALRTALLIMLLGAMGIVNAQVSTWDGTWEPWTHGTGTEANPFLIENAQQLAYLAYRVNNGLDAGGGHVSNHDYHYKLMIDVNLNGSNSFQWTSIGYRNSDTDYQCFGGCFNGNGHVVSGLYINSSAYCVGFFGYSKGTIIQNLSIDGNTIATTGGFAGGIIGVADETSVITNCYSTGTVSSSTSFGGIVGFANMAEITSCYNTGTVSSSSAKYSGGIVGYAYTAEITNCYNTGTVSSSSSNFTTHSGGIVGFANMAEITNCYNTGTVSSSNSSSSYSGSGGIVGFAEMVEITNCYNTGTVSSSNSYSSSYSGGIVGYAAYTAEITNCYNTGTVSSSYSGGIVGQKDNGTVTNSYYLNTCGGNNTYGGSPMSADAMHSSEFVDILNNGTNVYIRDSYNVNQGYPVFPNMPYLRITTTSATNITNTHATLNGEAFSTEMITSQGFEYRKTSETNSQSVNVSSSGVMSKTISGLTPGTQYTYRTFCVVDGFGIVYSNDELFTTNAIIVTTHYATNVTQTHATLNGTLNVGDANVTAQGFEYKASSDPSYQTINVSGNGNVSHTLSGLMPNTSYTYRTFCTVTGSGTTYGEIKTFTTLPVSITTNFATDVTANSAVLHGYKDIGDATLVSKGFEYRAEGETNYTSVYVEGDDNEFNAQIAGLQLNTTYEYRAFMNIAESSTYYYGSTRTFEVTWLNLDTIYINNAEMLRWVSEQCNSGITFEGYCIKLMNDITLPLNVPNNMTSIGTYPNYPFKGTFDGNGMHITNLYIDQPNTPYQGFFGYTLNANLYNVGLVNITASGRNYTGGMVAYAENTYMRDCYVNGGTLFALSYCGGLVGYQEQGTNSIISGCYNTCEVTGNNYVGGLVGFSNYSTVRNSYVAAMVAAQGEAVGAIIGGANEVLMYYCYFNSELTGQTNAIGWNNTGKDGGEAMTSAQMRDPQFVATLNQGLTVHVWKQDYTLHINNGFPILQWQQSTGVDENEASSVVVYPNPTNGIVTIEAENLNHIIISNLLGQTIYEGNVSGNEFIFDFSKHKVGIYLIRIETASGVAVKKVSVTR